MSKSILCLYGLTLLLKVKVTFCQENKDCDQGYECIPNVECAGYQDLRNQLRNMEKSSPEYKDLLSKTRKLVCNRARRRICCRVEVPEPPVSVLGQRESVSSIRSSDPSSPSFVPSGNECGVAVKSAAFIVGGNDTELGEFPWMVLLGKDKPTGDIIWHCGGTLINKWYVLTAAHCNKVDFVRLGEWKVVDTNTFDRQECLY